MAPPDRPAFADPEVQKVFDAYDPAVRPRMLELRAMVLDTADDLDLHVVEALRWGEPAYLCKRGSTLRMDSKSVDSCTLYVNCQTKLIAEFRSRYADTLQFEGARAVQLPMSVPLPEAALRDCISLTLTYKRWKNR
ncbi:MAG: DUF1801 domain-containing protein [Myxococcota bacterium]